MNDSILLEWVEKNQTHQKQINRQDFYDIMNSIRKGFYDDNEISTIFVGIIPDLVFLSINKDRNSQKEDPFVYCKTTKEEKTITIKRYHKIIWSILDRYTQEE